MTRGSLTMVIILLFGILLSGTLQGFCNGREIFISPSGKDNMNCAAVDNPCLTIQHAIDNVAFSDDVIKIDASHGHFIMKHSVAIKHILNVTFTSYNGVAWIYVVGTKWRRLRYGTFLINDCRSDERKCEIVVNSINFLDTTLVRSSLFQDIYRITTTLTVNNCYFEFSKSETQIDLDQTLILMKCQNSFIMMENFTIRANYQIGILSYSVSGRCYSFTSTSITIKHTRIEDALYTVYAILKDCTDMHWKKSFKLSIINTTVRSRKKHQSRTPQIMVAIGPLYKRKIWLSIYMENSCFENLSVLSNTAAVMNIQGTSEVVIRNCTFNGNIGNRGGALAFQSAFLTIVDSHFHDNQAREIALCAHNDQGGCGGAISVRGLSKVMELRIYNSSFTNNMAACFGSAVYLGYFKTISVKGTQFSTRFTSLLDTIWYSYSENLRIDKVSFEVRKGSKLDGRLFFARSKALNFGEIAPIFKCPLGSTINTSESSRGISGKDKSTEVRCQHCPKGTYTLTPSRFSGFNSTRSKQCHSCSFGAVCQQSIKPRPNFWGYVHKGKAFMIVCPPGYCCQTPDQCISLNSCNSKRTGRLCGKCKHGYFQSIFSNDCLEEKICKTEKFWTVAILMCLLLTVLFVFLQDIFSVILKVLNLKKVVFVTGWLKDKLPLTKGDICKLEGGNSKQERCCDPIDNEPRDNSASEEAERNDEAEMNENKTEPNSNSTTPGLIKIVFFFYQTHSVLTVYKSNREIQYLRDLKAIVLGIFNLNVQLPLRSEFHCPLHGMESIRKIWIKALFPVDCLIFAGSLYASIYALSNCFSRSSFIQKCSTKVKPKLLVAIMQLILLGYSTLTSSILSLVSCISLVNGDRILLIDGNEPCYQPWQYAILIFIVLWAIPLIYALHRLSNYMRNEDIATRGVFAALLLPLPFAIYSMMRRVRKTRSVTSDDSSNGQCEIPYIKMKRREIAMSQLLNVVEGPFRYKTSGEKREKLSWEPVFLLQRILLSLCHTFVLQPGIRSLLLLLFIIIFLYINARYRPFASSFLNTANDITLTLLCIAGIINTIYAFIYENGIVPKGPLVQLLDVFDYLEVAMIFIFPLIALVIFIVLAVAKFTAIFVASFVFLIDKCKSCDSNDN